MYNNILISLKNSILRKQKKLLEKELVSITVPIEVQQFMELLQQYGSHIAISGGFVRDKVELPGRRLEQVADIDMITDREHESVKTLLNQIIDSSKYVTLFDRLQSNLLDPKYKQLLNRITIYYSENVPGLLKITIGDIHIDLLCGCVFPVTLNEQGAIFNEIVRYANSQGFDTNDIDVLFKLNVMVYAEVLYQNSMRRDYFCNALYAVIANVTSQNSSGSQMYMQVVDPTQQGLLAVKKMVVDIIGIPTTRFMEDPILLMRFVKLLAKGYIADEKLLNCVKSNVFLIGYVVPAKLYYEWRKLFMQINSNVIASYGGLRNLGFLDVLFPIVGGISWDNADDDQKWFMQKLLSIDALVKETQQAVEQKSKENKSVLLDQLIILLSIKGYLIEFGAIYDLCLVKLFLDRNLWYTRSGVYLKKKDMYINMFVNMLQDYLTFPSLQETELSCSDMSSTCQLLNSSLISSTLTEQSITTQQFNGFCRQNSYSLSNLHEEKIVKYILGIGCRIFKTKSKITTAVSSIAAYIYTEKDPIKRQYFQDINNRSSIYHQLLNFMYKYPKLFKVALIKSQNINTQHVDNMYVSLCDMICNKYFNEFVRLQQRIQNKQKELLIACITKLMSQHNNQIKVSVLLEYIQGTLLKDVKLGGLLRIVRTLTSFTLIESSCGDHTINALRCLPAPAAEKTISNDILLLAEKSKLLLEKGEKAMVINEIDKICRLPLQQNSLIEEINKIWRLRVPHMQGGTSFILEFQAFLKNISYYAINPLPSNECLLVWFKDIDWVNRLDCLLNGKFKHKRKDYKLVQW